MRRLPSLTSARFFAALFVVAFHTVPFIGVGFLIPLLRIGYTGVSFFFALSGFVLTWGAGRGVPSSVFYRRRFARIWPLFATTLVIWFIINTVQYHMSPYQQLARLIVGLALLQAWIPHSAWYFGNNGVTWSLSAEAAFYAVTPRLLRTKITRPADVMFLLAGTTIAAQIGLTILLPGNVEQWATYIVPLSGLPAFACGHLLARAMKEGRFAHVPWLFALAAPAACLAVGATFVAHKIAEGSSPFFFMGGVASIALPGWLVLIAALARADEAGRSPLGRPGLVRLGEWSYALYLLHPLVINAFESTSYYSLHAPKTLLTVGIWAAAVAISGIAYVVLERPAEDRLRHGRPERPLPGDIADRAVGATPT